MSMKTEPGPPRTPAFAFSILETALAQPTDAIGYHAGRSLRERFPGRAMMECASCGFDLLGFLDEGKATATEVSDHGYNQILATWRGCGDGEDRTQCGSGEEGIDRRPVNAWLRIDWNGRSLEVVGLTWREFVHSQRRWFLLGESMALLEEFYAAVCRWSAIPHGEVLIFEKGTWRKDRHLYSAIREARVEDLVLSPGLREELFNDVRRFFDGREVYERLGVPWKRGVLLLGPPGNGKTHAIRALCREMGRPVLYVRSLESAGMFQTGEQGHVSEVFELARRTSPCLLILEDLDSILTPANRSVLLNELDGFAQNSGLCVLATTNYPERLDASVLDRPSRFDRKYTFDLPGTAERKAYLEHWTRRQAEELRLRTETIDALAAGTEEFSFAYLKELCLATAMARVNAGAGESTDSLALEQARQLQAQRRSEPSETPAAPAPTKEDVFRKFLENS